MGKQTLNNSSVHDDKLWQVFCGKAQAVGSWGGSGGGQSGAGNPVSGSRSALCWASPKSSPSLWLRKRDLSSPALDRLTDTKTLSYSGALHFQQVLELCLSPTRSLPAVKTWGHLKREMNSASPAPMQALISPPRRLLQWPQVFRKRTVRATLRT